MSWTCIEYTTIANRRQLCNRRGDRSFTATIAPCTQWRIQESGGRPPPIDWPDKFLHRPNVKGNPRMHQNQPFQAKNSIFLGRGHSLLPRPLPSTVRPIIKFWIRHCLYSPWWHSSLGRKNQRLFSINRPIRKPGQLHWQCFPNMPIFSDRPKKTPKNPTPEIIFPEENGPGGKFFVRKSPRDILNGIKSPTGEEIKRPLWIKRSRLKIISHVMRNSANVKPKFQHLT